MICTKIRFFLISLGREEEDKGEQENEGEKERRNEEDIEEKDEEKEEEAHCYCREVSYGTIEY